jgi:hypothetical protein
MLVFPELASDEDAVAATEAVLIARLRALKDQLASERAEFRAREAEWTRRLKLAREQAGPPRSAFGGGLASSAALAALGELDPAIISQFPGLQGSAARQVAHALSADLSAEERIIAILKLGASQQAANVQLDALATRLIEANVSADNAMHLARGLQAEFAAVQAEWAADASANDGVLAVGDEREIAMTASLLTSRLRREVIDSRLLSTPAADRAHLRWWMARAAALEQELGETGESLRAELAASTAACCALGREAGRLEERLAGSLRALHSERTALSAERDARLQAQSVAADLRAKLDSTRAELEETLRRYRTLIRKLHVQGLHDGPDEQDDALGVGGGVFGRLQGHARMHGEYRDALQRSGTEVSYLASEQAEEKQRVHEAQDGRGLERDDEQAHRPSTARPRSADTLAATDHARPLAPASLALARNDLGARTRLVTRPRSAGERPPTSRALDGSDTPWSLALERSRQTAARLRSDVTALAIEIDVRAAARDSAAARAQTAAAPSPARADARIFEASVELEQLITAREVATRTQLRSAGLRDAQIERIVAAAGVRPLAAVGLVEKAGVSFARHVAAQRPPRAGQPRAAPTARASTGLPPAEKPSTARALGPARAGREDGARSTEGPACTVGMDDTERADRGAWQTSTPRAAASMAAGVASGSASACSTRGHWQGEPAPSTPTYAAWERESEWGWAEARMTTPAASNDRGGTEHNFV